MRLGGRREIPDGQVGHVVVVRAAVVAEQQAELAECRREVAVCERGEARHFVADGNIQLGGGLPLNPHGGQLGEAYIHGMNGITEAVRQIRGTSVNQVDDVVNVLVTSGSGPPTSGLIVGQDR